jgi:hypothetical protein
LPHEAFSQSGQVRAAQGFGDHCNGKASVGQGADECGYDKSTARFACVSARA